MVPRSSNVKKKDDIGLDAAHLLPASKAVRPYSTGAFCKDSVGGICSPEVGLSGQIFLHVIYSPLLPAPVLRAKRL